MSVAMLSAEHTLTAVASWDLPWPPLRIPAYKEMTLGAWTIRWTSPLAQWRYFHPTLVNAGQYTLLAGDESWMSTAPIEIEGQVHHVAAARGHVLVMGAGMGVVLFNILPKPDVTGVTLVERDPAVIDLLREAAGLERWPGIHKLSIAISDAFEYHSPACVDYLYVDIWARPAEPQALADTQCIQHHVRAGQVGWWTQEVSFLRWLEQLGAGEPTLEHYRAWAREIDLPLGDQHNPAYMRCIAQLAETCWYQEVRRAEQRTRSEALAHAG